MLSIEWVGNVVTLSGAGETPLAETLAALEEISGGYDCRTAVLPIEGKGDVAATREELLALERVPLPLIAAITGPVSGASTSLALACDIRVMAASSTISGMRMGTRRVLALLGEEGSVAVMERGGRVDAETALAVGLATEIADDAVAAALRLASVIASRGPIATRTAKEAIWRGLPMPLETALRFETDLTILLQSTHDRAEGVRAFVEKRTPTFTGD